MPRKKPMPDKGIVRVTFTLPAEVEAEVIHLVGEFTGWEGTPMERQKDGSWRTVVDLAPGRSYQFRYQIDGVRWENDWDADRYVANPFGQENSVVETPELDRPRRTGAPEGGRTRHPAAAPPPSEPAGAAGAGTVRQASSRRTAAKQAAAGKTPGAQATHRNVATTEAERELAASPAATGVGRAGPRGKGPRKAATKKAATKKSATKKAATKKAATKKSATKKSATKKSATKKSATKKSATKKAATKKTAGKRASASADPPSERREG